MATTAPLSPPVPMQTHELWAVRLLAFALWAAVAGSALYWGLSSPRADASAPAPAVVQTLQADPQHIAALLGRSEASVATSAPSPWASRVQVRGVVAQWDGSGVAILSVDGQPFKPYRTGQSVADGWVVQSLDKRSVVVRAADGRQTATLELPASSAQGGGATATGNAPAYGAAVPPTPAAPMPLPQPVPMAANPARIPPPNDQGVAPVQAGLPPAGMRKWAEKNPSPLHDGAQGMAPMQATTP